MNRRGFLGGMCGMAGAAVRPGWSNLLGAPPEAQKTSAGIVGVYVHQHWPYNHPYCARTWSVEDYRGYADGLVKLGFNTMMIWPVLETMPSPLTPSDRANLEKVAKVIAVLHHEFNMRVWLALCPNVAANNQEAAQVHLCQAALLLLRYPG